MDTTENKDGVAAESVAWAYEERGFDFKWRPIVSMSDPGELPWVRNVRPLYEHPPVAAAPTPPAGGGETLSAVDLDTLDWVASELSGKGQTVAAAIVTKAARIALTPASPAGDLNSLSAGATQGPWSDVVLMGEPANRKLASALVNAYRTGRLVEAAPAAPRKGPSEDEIARLIQNAMAEHLGLDSDNDIVGTGPASYQASRRILALLTSADRGETHKIIEAADCIGVRGATWALTIQWPDGTETVEHVSDHGARALGYVPDGGEG